MSYEPTLIIDKTALNKKGADIESRAMIDENDKALQYVYKLLIQQGVKFKGEYVIICQPELTSFNKSVREWLFEFDIEYAESN